MTSLINKVKAKVTGEQPLILVSGASGFIAAHILTSFLSKGYRVRGTVRSEATAEKVRKSHSQYEKQLEFAIVPDVAASGAFDEAVKGVDGVIHTASPFVLQVENNQRDLLDPAIKGTNEMMEAVQKYAPQVKHIVITSSFAAIADLKLGIRPGYTYSEKDWNPVKYDEAKDGDSATAYCASKTFAERAAFDFVEKNKPNFTVSSICPPMVYGPVEQGNASLDHLNTSAADVYRFMNGSQKEVGPTQFPAYVDVRDVAEAHERSYARGQTARYFAAAGNFQYPELCSVIREAIPSIKDKVPDPAGVDQVETYKVDNAKIREELGIKFHSFHDTITDTAKSLIRLQSASA